MKVIEIAVREFVATVATKGFIIGVLVLPAVIGVLILLLPVLMHEEPPKIEGEIGVIDPTGEIAERLEDLLAPEALALRRAEQEAKIEQLTGEGIGRLAGANPATQQIISSMLGEVPVLHTRALAASSDVEAAKDPLRQGAATEGGRLALVVVHPDAIAVDDPSAELGTYDLYVREKLDDRIVDEIQAGLRRAIVSARLTSSGMDPERIRRLTDVPRVRSTTVTATGEQETNEVLNLLVPGGFMILLLVSVFSGGQYIMTTTIEEKSNRVVEILLSAVSPMQLMTGKILGQMGVGLLILGIYGSMGVAALVSFAFLGLIDPWLFLYLFIFFFLSYFVLASLMAAIGSSVNELSEAQSLMTPVMLTMMIPWLLWVPILRDPNSVFATVTSFLPPINTFVMLLRMTSTTPPPLWQVWLTIAIGAVSVYVALWFAAKVFRIGLLMYGKPPTLATLIRWARMA
jgi:ABC-2 type transport system permease protein